MAFGRRRRQEGEAASSRCPRAIAWPSSARLAACRFQMHDSVDVEGSRCSSAASLLPARAQAPACCVCLPRYQFVVAEHTSFIGSGFRFSVQQQSMLLSSPSPWLYESLHFRACEPRLQSTGEQGERRSLVLMWEALSLCKWAAPLARAMASLSSSHGLSAQPPAPLAAAGGYLITYSAAVAARGLGLVASSSRQAIL